MILLPPRSIFLFKQFYFGLKKKKFIIFFQTILFWSFSNVFISIFFNFRIQVRRRLRDFAEQTQRRSGNLKIFDLVGVDDVVNLINEVVGVDDVVDVYVVIVVDDVVDNVDVDAYVPIISVDSSCLQ